ncbi:TROVE domain-containing protein [Thermomonospora cellulosilytica]|nr:TROVE domain-containing protein [Thermomonospora cellulosilytica]
MAGWLQGPLTARFWEAIIPNMGLFALIRNLRNFDRAGVGDQAAELVAGRLADAERVRRSRVLPMRFLAAYRAAPSLRWAWPLQRALDASLANVPRLPGRTLVLVDRPGSMFYAMSRHGKLTQADAAALFGAALALRADRADLVEFGTGHRPVPFRRGESSPTVVERFGNLGGTNTAAAVRAHHRGHDRVVIVTDEQVWAGRDGENPTRAVPDRVPVYTWNLAGYRQGHGPSGAGTRHTFAGLSDAAFAMIPLIERGQAADWPF